MTSIISAARSAIRSVTGTERSDDGFGGTLRRAPDWLDPRYDEGGEDADTPWWQTPFLEVPATERRRGPRGRRDADDDDHDDHDDHDGITTATTTTIASTSATSRCGRRCRTSC